MSDQIAPGADADLDTGNTAVTGHLAADDALCLVLRDCYRTMVRALQYRITPHGVGMGQWFFLRALWDQDGLTQRELSQRVGMMEPTTVTALNSMERRGLVVRRRNQDDRRKVNIYLTPKGRALRDVLMPLAAEAQNAATADLAPDTVAGLTATLSLMVRNLDSDAARVGLEEMAGEAGAELAD